LAARASTTPAVGETVDCAIRAEQIAILEEPGAPYDNTVTGRIAERIFEGDRVVYEIAVAAMSGAQMMVFDHDPAAHREHRVGDTVTLGFNARDVFAFPIPTTNTETREMT
ncbi:MAG: TOBE domain-containing protein, partial [Pseudomonadota bacterium]